jgi:hypothetical protein
MKNIVCLTLAVVSVALFSGIAGAAATAADETTGASDASTTTTLQAVTSTTLKQSMGGGSCIESDGGRNYAKKGVTNAANGRKTDECRSPGLIEEWYCDGNLAKLDLHPCGCSQGICRGAVLTSTGGSTTATRTTTSTSQTTTTTLKSGTAATAAAAAAANVTPYDDGKGCVDSDGGKTYGLKGATNATNGYYVDKCLIFREVREWFCVKGKADSVIYKCKWGCKDGACLKEQNIETMNSAAIGQATSSSVTTTSTTSTTARATTTTTLMSTGASAGGCSETDKGKEYNVKGVSNGANGRYDDKCQNPTDLKEYFCEGATVKSELHQCGHGCISGACR